jgi:hypothetical protein
MMKRLLLSLLLSCSLVSLTFGQDIDRVERNLEEARWLIEQAMDAVTKAQDALYVSPAPVTDIQAEFISRNVIEVTFNNHSGLELDVQYYSPGTHTAWQHSYAEYVGPIAPGEDRIVIGVNQQDSWNVRVVAGDWTSDTVIVEPYEEEVVELSAKKITVVESNKDVLNTPVPNGLIRHNGRYRLYFFERNEDRMLYAESNDLESWTSHKYAGFETGGGANLVQDENGQVYLYEGDGDDLYIYELNGRNLDRLENRRLAYSWRIDGKLVISIIDGDWYATGRVRGNRDTDSGGWGDELPPYPDLDELPFIKQEYEEHLPSYRDPDDYIKDRRGISLHTSDNGMDWSDGQIIADPIDYEFEEFEGWTQRGEDGIGDFYSSTLLDDRRMIVKAYMKEKDRVVDRWDYAPDMSIERRFRFTGETILVPALYQDGKVELVSTESIIPREYHERKTPQGLDYVTCVECKELGQVNNGNEVIFKDGYAYIPYGYRDDVHYEGFGWTYYTGVYIYRVPIEEFDRLFER